MNSIKLWLKEQILFILRGLVPLLCVIIFWFVCRNMATRKNRNEFNMDFCYNRRLIHSFIKKNINALYDY